MAQQRRSRFGKSILNNGAVLVTESLPQFESLSVGVWVNAGTRHETKQEAGISHFLEHMMFKGTKKRSALEIAQAVDCVGGEFNAFTSREYTCFHLLLLSRDLKLSVDILADVLLNSKFDAVEIERERKVILQEVAMVEENTEEYVYDVFFDQAFGGHPLGRPILGDIKSISNFDRGTLVNYFQKHYTPGQMILSVAGNFEHKQVERLLNHALGKAKGGASNARPSVPAESKLPPEVHAGVRFMRKSSEQAHLVIGVPGLPFGHSDRFAMLLLNVYLGGGMSSSLFQEIREKRGLAYSIYSSIAPFSDAGLFSVYIGTSPDEVATCLGVTGAELSKLKDKALAKKDLQILKENLKGTILLNSDSVESRMNSIARNEMFFGQYFSAQDICKQIDQVTTKDLHRLANQLFDPNKLILTWMGPGKAGQAKTYPEKLFKALQKQLA